MSRSAAITYNSKSIDDLVPLTTKAWSKMFSFADLNGRILDSNFRPLHDGQEGEGSIFHVASKNPKVTVADPAQLGTITSADGLLEASRHHGFKRRKYYNTSRAYMCLTEDPQKKSEPPSPPSSEPGAGDAEVPEGLAHPITCAHCWAVVRDKERYKGFTLAELHGAAGQGCKTCDVLQKSIRHFADLIFPSYEGQKVRVSQSLNQPSRLLSQTKKVSVTFEEHGGETISIQFSDRATQDNEKVGGRIVNTSSEEADKPVKSWLTTCSADHEACVIPPVPVLPRRVLDVSGSDVRLLETHGQRAPYVTLSHCWGRQTVTRVTKARLEGMKQEIPWADLTQTFQDAVMITRKLGFQYLWIDGLCILQDDQQEWEIEVSNMSRIFSNSQLTIAASRAAGPDQGCWSSRLDEPFNLCCGDDREIRDPKLWQPYRIEGLDREGHHKTFAATLGFQHGLFRRKRPVEPLLKRAWVFQEQILSPRIIHYASGELFFECKTHIACECSGWSPRSESWDWETRWRKAHAVLVNRDMTTQSMLGEMQTQLREFEAYKTLIETYTQLDITNELDRLPALSGLVRGRNDDYLAGMWRSFLLMALHWVPASESPRGIMARRPHQYRAPTWSWASMEVPVQHIGSSMANSPFDALLCATVLDVWCTPEGADPRGRVRDGYLRIQGDFCVATVTHIGICERQGWGHDGQLERLAQVNPGWVDLALVESEENKLCTYASLKGESAKEEGQGEGEGEGEGEEKDQAVCYLDVPLVLARKNPAEVSIGDYVVCLVVSKSLCLILRPSRTTQGVFYRAGILYSQGKAWKAKRGVVSIY